MSSGYAKLFHSIIHSTVWQEPLPTKVVWITLLAMKDRGGEVYASLPGLAKAAGVTQEECAEALEKLKAPDFHSRTKTDEGRRIREIDGGWLVINHEKYQRLLSAEDRREKNAEYQRRTREKKKQGKLSAPVSKRQEKSAQSPHIAVDEDVDVTTTTKHRVPTSAVDQTFALAWQLYPKRSGTNSRADALAKWRASVAGGADPAAMIAGTKRYREYCERAGKVGTELVMQAVRFYGRGRHWEQSFEVGNGNGRSNASDRVTKGHENLRRWAEEPEMAEFEVEEFPNGE